MRPRPTCWRRCIGKALPETLPLTPQLTYDIPLFDIDAWLVEIALMLEWYLPDRGADVSQQRRDEFVAMWRELLEKPAAAARTWVMRDFHSPNIIWLGDRHGIQRVGMIDFQDAVLGPAAYDLVSLLQDARIDVPEQLELTLLTRYITHAPRRRRRFRSGRFRRTLRDHVGAAKHTSARHLCPAQPARRQAAISAPPAPDLDLSEPFAGASGAGGVSPMVCGERAAARCLIYLLLASLALIWNRPCRRRGFSHFETGMRPWRRRNGARETRVTFERGFAAHMMGIDGTWRRDCVMEDVSETGAKLTVEGSVEGLHLKEFFLLLSSTGLAYRRCELAWVNGDQIGVNFLKQGDKKKKAAKRGTEEAQA